MCYLRTRTFCCRKSKEISGWGSIYVTKNSQRTAFLKHVTPQGYFLTISLAFASDLWMSSRHVTNVVNAFRYGLDTDRQADGFDQAELGGGLGYLDVSVAGVQLGPATYLPRVEPLEVRHEIADDVSWTKGKHTIKSGFTFEHVNDNVNYLSGRYGSYTYATPTSFAQDYSGNTAGAKNYSGYTQTFGNPLVDYIIKDIGFYLEDQWKATDSLTLTVGARYEHSFMPPPPTANPSVPADRSDAAHRLGESDAAHRTGLPAQR